MDDLRELLTDAVADVEPADRLGEIRARTASPDRRTRRSAGRWWYGVGGSLLAGAATVAAVVVLSGDDAGRPDVARAPDPSVLVAVYYLGDTPDGARLFREFDRVRGDDPVAAALERLGSTPDDPDYRTSWPSGSLLGATVEEGEIVVRTATAALPGDGAEPLASQQVVLTLQAALRSSAPVRFVGPDGTSLDGPVAAEPPLDVLNLVSISDPTEGASYDATFVARGRASSFEGTVHWELVDGAGSIVRRGFTTAGGSWSERLEPWEAEVDLTGVAPGRYTFVVREDDPTGGGEPGFHPDVDTRTVVVE